MARPISERQGNFIPFQPSDKQVPTMRTYFVPPGGMNTAKRLNELDPATARLVQNLMIRDEAYQVRFGTSEIGSVSLTEVVFIAEFVLSNGDSYMVRWRYDGVDILNAGTWVPVNGDAVEANYNTTLAITSWNDTIVFGTQKGKLKVLSFSPEPTITELSDSPLFVKHICTFNNRVLASIGRKVKWCINRDNTDWSGTGSGEEELLGAPGGKVDEQTAVYPVTDEIAYAIRSNSVWQVSVTGSFDAPFRFTRIWQGKGGLYPLATCEIPRGVAFLSQDGVSIVDPQAGLREIGMPIRRSILPLSRGYLRRSCLVYDVREDELRLSIPDGNQAAHKVYRCFEPAGQNPRWTVDYYPFVVRAMSFTRFSQSVLTIDELNTLAGTIDTLPVGTIDDLGVTDRSVGLLFALEGDSKRTTRENDSIGNSIGARDQDSAGLDQPTEWRIESGFVFGGTSTEKTHITEIQVEYESEAAATLLFEYSDDGGNTWNQYDVVTVGNTNGTPAIAKGRGSLYRNNLTIAVSCADSPNMRLIAVHPIVDSGAQVADAG